MRKQLLSTAWTLERVLDHTTYPTTLPSSVYTTLLDYGVIPDPYWKDNEHLVTGIMEEDFIYQCTFDVDAGFLKEDSILIKFDGLDTLADIYLNEILIGSAENMHRVWEFPVNPLLKSGENTLKILLHSPLKAADQAFATCQTRGTEDAWEGFSHIRKAHYMYGWDWGAHLPDAGLFREVSLVAFSHARIDSVYIEQDHQEDLVRLTLSPTFNRSCSPAAESDFDQLGVGYTCQITVSDPDQTICASTQNQHHTVIESPQLWWPNGLGDQPLYTVAYTLFYEGQKIDCWCRRIGLRTMTVRTEPDQWGESFAHEVNGKTIFAMGADYIPEEHLIPRKSPDKTRQLLTDCKLANFNSIRIWGGGYYPDDTFFDLCDELGLVVWEDFMFACSMYELTPDFESNIIQEMIDNVKRIRHHASLGMWCGNNEMESFTNDNEWVSKPSEIRDYLLMYERIIPEVLKKYDPVTFYWPSSPSSGGSFDDPQSPDRGDVHFWQVWHGNKPFSEYRKYYFRYLSEFGFQSFPALATIKEGISDDPDDLNIFSYVMEKHQRNLSANGKIMSYLQQTYKYPYDLSSVIYASQLLQADAIRYGVEHFRRNRGRCMGAVYWQLNDCWPVISWSSIDYYGRWKALHYYAKRFFAPVMLSCEEENWMTAEADMNRQHFPFEKSIRLNVTNETLSEKQLTIRWALRNADASIVRSESAELKVPALDAVWLNKVTLPEADIFEQYVSYEALEGDTVISSGTVIFSLPKYFHYQDPHFTCQVSGDEIIIQTDVYAKSVEILNENEDLLLSDNYFDMNAGTARVKVLRGNTDNLQIRSVYDIGK